MTGPELYFELNDEPLAPLFDRVTHVWEALQRLRAFIDDRLDPQIRGDVRSGAWLYGPVFLGEGAVVEPGAYVEGPAIIGRGAVVRHGAYVRPYALIGDGCVVGHATEVKHAVMLTQAQAPHFNYVGDSILGRGVNLGAGTKLSNLKNEGTEVRVQVDGTRLGTGMRKFGAIVGDGAHLGCNCVAQPGTLVGKRTAVYPNLVLRGVYPPEHIVKLRQSELIVERQAER